MLQYRNGLVGKTPPLTVLADDFSVLKQDRSLKLRTPESADTRITTVTNFKMKQIFKSIHYFRYGCSSCVGQFGCS